MTYLLDTNVCVKLLNNSHPNITARLAAEKPENIFLCTVVQLELIFGAYHSQRVGTLHATSVQENLAILERFFSQFRILTLDEQAAKIGGRIRANLATLGTPIGPYDLAIAAIAVANNLILVTHNTREFNRINELQIEDWELS